MCVHVQNQYRTVRSVHSSVQYLFVKVLLALSFKKKKETLVL